VKISILSSLFSLLILVNVGIYAAEPLHKSINQQISTAWKQNNLSPAEKSSDEEFLRRVTLDLLGTIPTSEEVISFLKDNDPQKREKLIDQYLVDPRFSQSQTLVWDQVLFGRNPLNPEATRKRDGFRAWLTAQFNNKIGLDQIAKKILLAEEEGSELFLVQYRSNPEEATVGVTRIFMGTQLQCARCHDHPFDKWTQKDFYGMAGFFVRLVVLDGGGTGPEKKYKIGEKSTGEVLFTGAAKDQKPGQKGEPIKPKFLGAEPLNEPSPPMGFKEEPVKEGAKTLPKPFFSRKEKFAEWLAHPKNPYFAKAMVNRIWGQFMGRGIVHPVDDLGDHHKPELGALLDQMTTQFIENKFDIRWLIREIVLSDAYQLSSKGPSREASLRFYERARVRPLSAEEIMLAIRQATGYDVDNKTPSKLPNAGEEYFLRYFGEPLNGLGEFQGSLGEHLFWNNSDNIKGLIRRKKGNLADQLLTSKEPPEAKVEKLFLAVLSRRPSEKETSKFVEFLSAAGSKPEGAVEDAIWVLLNSPEFRFNH
jgi:hypothetical protein